MLKPLLTGQWLRTVGLTVTLLLALLPARAQDIGTTFDVGNLTYRVLTENTVEVAGYQDVNYGVTFEIPTKVEHDGSVYDVVAIGDAGLRHAPFGSLTLPKSIKTIGEFGLWNCSVLSSLLMEGVETLESKSLGVNFLKTFVLPESLKSIASDALIDCEINSLFFQSVTPPTLSNGDGGLTGIDKIGQIYVPVGSLKAYQDWSPEYSTKFEELPQISGGAKSVSLNQTEIFTIHGEMTEVRLQATVVADGEYTGEYIWHPKYGGMPEVNVDPSDPSKATVCLYNPMEGVVSIEVEGDNGLPLTASCKFIVLGAEIRNWHICLPPNSTANVKASVQPASLAKDYSLRYTSSNPAVATVDENGDVTAVSRGFCKIIVDVMNNGQVVTSNTATADVVTEEDVVPDCGSPFMMKAGEKRSVYLKFPSDIANGWVNWTSSNPEVVKASGEKIEAIGDGITTVTGQYELSDGTTLPVSLEVIVGNVATGDEFTVDGIIYRVLTAKTVEVAGPADGVTPTDVVIPTKVNYECDVFDVVAIAQYAFDQCGQLTSISIPESVKSIGHGAFQSCSNLTSIDIPSTVTSIGYNTFYECYNLTSVELPEGLVSIDFQAFLGCSKLSSINFPEGLTSIGFGAFSRCNTLVSVVFPSSLQSIEGDFLRWCNNLNLIYFLGTIPPQITDDNDLYGLNQNVKIYVPAESTEVYKSWTEAYKDNIVGIERPANGATEVTLNHTSLLLTGRGWKDVTFNATVTTESGNEYDGDYLWDVSPNWTATITTTEEAPNEASINLFNDQVHTVTVTVYSPEGTPLTASCDLIPLDILIPNSRISMLKGEDYNLDASITPDNYSDLSDYTDLSIRFTSGNPQLVEVSEDGVITALEYGTVNILAEIVDADGNTITQTICAVNVCNSVRPQYSDITIPVQNGTWNYALLEPSWNTNFTLCESDDPQIASVSNEGWIRANSVGETDITLTYTTTTGHTFPSVTCHVKVVDEITGIRISAPNGVKTMTVGSKLQLKAVSEPDGDPVPVNWRINDGYVAYVNYSTGEVIAKNPGKCTITAQAGFDLNLIATYEITVTEDGEMLVDGITIDKSTVILNAGNSTQLNATVEPADAEVEIEWTSSNEDVASVDPLTGEVTANNTGVATITATVKGTDASASCTVIVSNPTGIDDVDTDGVSVKGINGQIIVTGAPADAAVEIYSIAGSRIAVEKGNCAVSVNAGIYVVRVAGTTVKVAVK